MFFIGGMSFALHLPPFMIGREESIGSSRCVGNLCEIETLSLGDSLPINVRPTYYIYILVGRAVRQRLLASGVVRRSVRHQAHWTFGRAMGTASKS